MRVRGVGKALMLGLSMLSAGIGVPSALGEVGFPAAHNRLKERG